MAGRINESISLKTLKAAEAEYKPVFFKAPKKSYSLLEENFARLQINSQRYLKEMLEGTQEILFANEEFPFDTMMDFTDEIDTNPFSAPLDSKQNAALINCIYPAILMDHAVAKATLRDDFVHYAKCISSFEKKEIKDEATLLALKPLLETEKNKARALRARAYLFADFSEAFNEISHFQLFCNSYTHTLTRAAGVIIYGLITEIMTKSDEDVLNIQNQIAKDFLKFQTLQNSIPFVKGVAKTFSTAENLYKRACQAASKCREIFHSLINDLDEIDRDKLYQCLRESTYELEVKPISNFNLVLNGYHCRFMKEATIIYPDLATFSWTAAQLFAIKADMYVTHDNIFRSALLTGFIKFLTERFSLLQSADILSEESLKVRAPAMK